MPIIETSCFSGNIFLISLFEEPLLTAAALLRKFAPQFFVIAYMQLFGYNPLVF